MTTFGIPIDTDHIKVKWHMLILF